MTAKPVLTVTPAGIYCPAGDFYIDPHRRVDRAVITHGHADHGRAGHKYYLASTAALPALRHRLGQISAEAADWGQPVQIGQAEVSFHPAGHIPGSAQIRVAVGGEIWVVSGDYKLYDDGLSEPFEPVLCHGFITECTFGLPIFHWPDPVGVAGDINNWWQSNRAAGQTCLLQAYSLGKAQRILRLLDRQIGPVLAHPAIAETTLLLRHQGYPLPQIDTLAADTDATTHPGALILAPGSAHQDGRLARFGPLATATASGWTRMRRRRGSGAAFILSDHADWAGLNTAAQATGAQRIWTTHGYDNSFAKWLTGQGFDARPLAKSPAAGP